MSLTLLVESNPRIIDIYLLNLSTYVGLDIMVVSTVNDALQVLDKQPFKLIISRASLEQKNLAELIAEKMGQLQLSIPLFVIGHGVYPKLATGVLGGSLDLKGVVKGAAQALGITAQQMAQKKVDDFFPIHSRYIQQINLPPTDLFEKSAEGQFHVIAPADQKLDHSLLPKDTFFYVPKLERLQIVNLVTSELISQLDDKDLNPDEVIQAGASNMELLSKKLMSIGITEETIQLAKKSMGSLAQNVKKNKELGKLLKRMLSNQAGYLFRHTQVVTYVSMHLVKNIDWGTPEQEEKINFICFFHDIALENDIQAKIKNKEELRKSTLDTREKNLVDKHAQLAAELVHKYPHAPMGADQIIRQHHGMLNGIGFSANFGANLSPMAIVFVVAEEYTRIIIERENGPYDAKEMVKHLKATFPTSRFQKMIEIVEKITF